ncbi:anthranilate synthase component I [Longimicrobium sp.]|uniref:anthranilate synthase component I n=1 Tax=Longimicrobium sp. TaxID=2029185 RepID=UPI002E351953|nr:anthranilate synthase component I [Longimicrobium sp.]HEX6040093.1 anthranilate synthase component I [Longimicrobium sp.]
MSPSPTLDEFLELARGGATLVPVTREFPFDTDTAVSAYHKLARPPFGFLLESVVGGETWARYTMLGSEPRAAWRLFGRRVETWTPATGWQDQGESDDPLGAFDRMLQAQRPAELPWLPRFWGGAVGYFGYDAVRLIERLPDAPEDDRGLPDAVFMLTGTVLVIDNLFNRARAVVAVQTGGVSENTLHERYHSAVGELDRLIGRLGEENGPDPLDLDDAGGAADGPFESSMTCEEYEDGVRRVQEYIRAGDAFQVVLSQRLTVPLAARPFDLYRALRTLNPSPYLFYLELDGIRLIGSSPEVMVRVQEGRVTVRPIAGTRRRGRDADEDERLGADLLADPKEVSEHLMLLDLGRNDVGRVARWGTVRVPQRMVIEKYSHVLHLVSTVEGELRDGMSAMDVFRASFPAGTVSGAPKVRAMEIIDELEPRRRGPYAGAVGYFGYGGRTMDTAIAIRTVVAKDGQAHVQAGAGIVADSVPAAEYDETLNKARALLRAVRMVGG